MKKGTKVNVKSINKNGVVMSSSNNRVSVMMADGTAKVFDVSDIEMLSKGGEVESGFKVEVNQYIPYGSSMGKNYYYVTDSKGKTISKKTKKVYRGKQMNEYKFNTKEDAQKFANSMNKKYAKGGGLGIIPAQGTMFTKEKKHKLDYKKVGDNYEFVVYEGDSNPVENYNRTSYKKKSDGVVVMNYNQFKNYIYAEGYINDKYAKGGSVSQDRENVEMVLNNNKQIAHHTKELPKAIKGKKVPAWVVAKVNRSASDLSDATHYMDGQGEEYGRGGFIYEIQKRGENLDIRESHYTAKNIPELRRKLIEKYGSLEGITASRRMPYGGYSYVKLEKGGNMYAQGGMVDGQYVDLFEYYEHIPDNIQAILDRYSEEFGGDGSDMDYQDTANMLKEVEAEGYTFNYYLDNEPYGLRPIGVKLNQLKDYEDFDEEDYAKGGRLTSNEDIIEAFLTSNREAKVGNLSTHYNEYDNQILLRNYGTLIASRKGNNVHITSIKYSVTTTKITNIVNRMAKDKGLNVKYVEKFEEGGIAKSCWCYEIGGL